MFLLFLFCGITWGVLALKSLNFDKILYWIHLKLFFCVGRLLIMSYISSWVIVPFKLLLWSSFNFGRWCRSRNLAISLSFQFNDYTFLKYALMIIWIFTRLSEFCFLPLPLSVIVLLWVFSFSFLFNLVKVLSVLLIFSKKYSFIQWFFALFVCFIYFTPEFDFVFLSSTPLGHYFNFFPILIILFHFNIVTLSYGHSL